MSPNLATISLKVALEMLSADATVNAVFAIAGVPSVLVSIIFISLLLTPVVDALVPSLPAAIQQITPSLVAFATANCEKSSSDTQALA